jgi:hypothetical protein
LFCFVLFCFVFVFALLFIGVEHSSSLRTNSILNINFAPGNQLCTLLFVVSKTILR